MAWTSWTIRGHLISGSVEQSFHCQSRLFLHPWEDVAVDVHREGDAGMTQSFAHDLRVYDSRQGQRRMCMAESMEGEMRQPMNPNELGELFADTVRISGRTVHLCEHIARVAPEFAMRHSSEFKSPRASFMEPLASTINIRVPDSITMSGKS